MRHVSPNTSAYERLGVIGKRLPILPPTGFREGNLATGMRISKEICTASRRTFQPGFDQDLVH